MKVFYCLSASETFFLAQSLSVKRASKECYVPFTFKVEISSPSLRHLQLDPTNPLSHGLRRKIPTEVVHEQNVVYWAVLYSTTLKMERD
jgi:hypothetical protein